MLFHPWVWPSQLAADPYFVTIGEPTFPVCEPNHTKTVLHPIWAIPEVSARQWARSSPSSEELDDLYKT